MDTTRTRRRRIRNSFIVGGVVVLLAAGGGTAWALDRFVVEHVEISDVAAYEAEQTAEAATAAPTPTETATPAETVVTDNSYDNGSTSITINQVVTGSGAETVTYYVADVVVSDATAVKSAFANNQFGENIIDETSDIAAANNAIFAINGDYYGFRDTGIVIRNGVVFRDEPARTGLAFIPTARSRFMTRPAPLPTNWLRREYGTH